MEEFMHSSGRDKVAQLVFRYPFPRVDTETGKEFGQRPGGADGVQFVRIGGPIGWVGVVVESNDAVQTQQ